MPLAIAAAGVLVVCLASIALSITGIIGRIPGLPGGSGGSTATAVHATPAINDQAVAPVATANQARPADRDIQHDPLTDR